MPAQRMPFPGSPSSLAIRAYLAALPAPWRGIGANAFDFVQPLVGMKVQHVRDEFRAASGGLRWSCVLQHQLSAFVALLLR
mmetsp:Transcript_25946/g.40609  ORF Transcript_25946/g.40609 Transcript_25946/m.40609 type:complete len:81 (+) Transcript_25946:121-363(+)